MTSPGIPWFAQGLQAQAQGQWSSAMLAYRRAVSADPSLADAWTNLSTAYRELGRLDSALEAAQQALAITPGAALAHLALAEALRVNHQVAEAQAVLMEALSLHPTDPALLSTMAGILHAQGADEAALDLALEALRQEPDRWEHQVNLGFACMRTGRLDDAAVCFEAALQTEPGQPRAAWNLAFTRLLQGQAEAAWPHFPARLQLPEARENLRPFLQPRWDGSPLNGSTLLVWGEQGFGDALMAARYLPSLTRLGGQVLVLTYAELLPLLRPLAPGITWLAEGDALPPFDLQIPLLDLLALRPEPPVPHLALDPAFDPGPTLRQLLPEDGRRRIGLAWAGNPVHVEDRFRSIDPPQLAPLADLGSATWVSLQKAPATLPPLPGLVDLGPHLASFQHTAWAMMRLDAVVTVDTAVAHLAGSLGRPVHLLLPHFPDWRWGWEGETTHWYPTARLHRQGPERTWTAPLRSLMASLSG